MDCILVSPDMAYEQGFALMVQDFYAYKETDKYAAFKPALENFKQYISVRQDEAQGINLPEGFVPARTYWLTDKHKTIYGTIRYRPVLNEHLLEIGGHIGFDIAPSCRRKGYGTLMLRLLLEKIDRKENSRVLLTCDAGNTGSRKIIESNGGNMDGTRYEPSSGKTILRYWILLA